MQYNTNKQLLNKKRRIKNVLKQYILFNFFLVFFFLG